MVEDRTPFGISDTKRFVSVGGEDRLYRAHPIKGHSSGSVELVDYMGGDETIIRAATATRGREIFQEDISQKEMLNYLVRSNILAPFGWAQLKFRIQAPISVGMRMIYDPAASVNEYSGRYSDMLDTANTGLEELSPEAREIVETLRAENFKRYGLMREKDFAREMARSGLGSNNDTCFFIKLPINELANMVRERGDDSSITRKYMSTMAQIASSVAPDAWNALSLGKQGNVKYKALSMPTDESIIDPGLNEPQWDVRKTRRVIAPQLEEKLFVINPIGEHGQVQASDYMGTDSSLAEAARTSYGKGTRTVNDDVGLLRTLIREKHTSPIEMAELAVELKAPLMIDPRQLGRHRTLDKNGFLSMYPLGSQWYQPPESEMKYQDRVNRQGRGNLMTSEDREEVNTHLKGSMNASLRAVKRLRELGVREDLIRESKGVGFYTITSRTGDILNWSKFIGLRADAHAQKEARDVAERVMGFIEAQAPISYRLIRDYWLDAVNFSVSDLGNIKDHDLMILPTDQTPEAFRESNMVIPVDKRHPEGELKFTREADALLRKVRRLRRSS